MSFTIHRVNTPTHSTIKCSGRLVLGEATAALREAMDGIGQGSRRLVLDLAGVTYVDSAGLGEMVRLKSKCDSLGIDVRLAGATGRTLSLLQLTKLATLFPLIDTASEGVAAK